MLSHLMILVGSALLAFSALASPAPSVEGNHMCRLDQATRGGILTIAETIPTTGEPSRRETWWKPGWPRGFFFAASWSGDNPADIIDSGTIRTFVMIFGTKRRLRIVIRRIKENGASQDVFAGPFSPSGQAPAANISWPTFRDMARDGAALEIVAMREDGRVASSARIATEDIARIETAVVEAQPAFDAIIADRVNRCSFETPVATLS